MTKLITKPSIIKAAGNKPKLIQEFIGRVNSDNSDISIAKMTSPEGWVEPAQTPEFDEYIYVIKGQVSVEHKGETFTVNENEVFVSVAGEKVRYSTPKEAEYIAICLPAFSPGIVNRD